MVDISQRGTFGSLTIESLYFFFIPLFNFSRLFGKRNSILSLVINYEMR